MLFSVRSLKFLPEQSRPGFCSLRELFLCQLKLHPLSPILPSLHVLASEVKVHSPTHAKLGPDLRLGNKSGHFPINNSNFAAVAEIYEDISRSHVTVVQHKSVVFHPNLSAMCKQLLVGILFTGCKIHPSFRELTAVDATDLIVRDLSELFASIHDLGNALLLGCLVHSRPRLLQRLSIYTSRDEVVPFVEFIVIQDSRDRASQREVLGVVMKEIEGCVFASPIFMNLLLHFQEGLTDSPGRVGVTCVVYFCYSACG